MLAMVLLPHLLVYPNIARSQDETLVMVPMLLNQTYNEASTRLRQLGLIPRRLSPPEECTQPMQLNRVLDQRPEAGALLRTGGVVSLVSCQPTIIDLNRQVPDLSGMELAEAKILLQRLGLKLRVLYKNDCFELFLQNKIVEQTPAPQSVVKRGSLVWVRICRYNP